MQVPDDVKRLAELSVFEFESWVQTTDFSEHPEGITANRKLVETVEAAIMADRILRSKAQSEQALL